MPRNSRPIDWSKAEEELAQVFDEVTESRRVYVSLQHLIWFFFKEKKISESTSIDSLVKRIRFFRDELAVFEVEGRPIGYTTLRKIVEFLAKLQKEYHVLFKDKNLGVERV